jgi:hypothetical protein
VFVYLAAFHIKETRYFTGEEDVIVPKHVLAEHGGVIAAVDTTGETIPDGEKKTVPTEKAIDASS